jgi:flagellar hook-associated protein 2
MSSSTNPIFTGSSSYSSDFAQVITRAQQIASLPITLLNNQKTSLTSEQTALNGLSGSFSSLQAAVISLGSAVGGANTSVTYSNSSIATATASAGALPGVYKIEVVDPGSQASATSAASGAGTVVDPSKTSISSALLFTLHANGKVYDYIAPAANTLSSLADAINTATKGDVKATVVNLGTTAAPSYQLSIQNTKYGALPITLDDGQGGPNLLGDETGATTLQYRINGQPAAPAGPLSSDTSTITVAPNLTLTALAAGSSTITVARSTTAISSALNSFVTAYNAAETALDGQRGTSGGALVGQGIIGTLSQSLRDLSHYSGPGTLSLADLGVAFDKTSYALTFDPTVLSATAAKSFQAVTDFLGNTTTGGFLKAATDTLNGVTDSTSGAIPTTLLGVVGEINDTSKRVTANQDLVDSMTENLNAQMAAADALIATMQQQASYFTNMFAAMTASQNAMK